MTALVVRYMRACCLLLLSAAVLLLSKKANSRMSQRAGYSALFTQLKLFRKVSNDKPIEHGRIFSAF